MDLFFPFIVNSWRVSCLIIEAKGRTLVFIGHTTIYHHVNLIRANYYVISSCSRRHQRLGELRSARLHPCTPLRKHRSRDCCGSLNVCVSCRVSNNFVTLSRYRHSDTSLAPSRRRRNYGPDYKRELYTYILAPVIEENSPSVYVLLIQLYIYMYISSSAPGRYREITVLSAPMTRAR